MPLYEFRCNSCGRVFERLCKMGESGKNLACPDCGTRGPRRLMSVCTARVAGESGGSAATGSSCSTCTSGNCATCH